VVAVECNGCNEALDAARKVVLSARRLARVADNAIANGDLHRARAALRDLQAHHPAIVDRSESGRCSREEEPIAFDSRRAYCNANASPSSSNSIVPFLLDFSTSTAVVPEAGAVTVAVTVAWPARGISSCMVP